MTMDESEFKKNRRDPLLTLPVYDDQRDFFLEDRAKSYNIVNNLENALDHREGVSWSITLDKFEYAILEYSAGYSLLECEVFMQNALTELERHKNQFPHKSFFYWEPDAFQFLLWSMSFAVLSGKPEALHTIVRMFGKNPQDNDDPLLSMLLARLGYIGLPRLDHLAFPKPYQSLYDAIKGDGVSPTKAERQESLTQYLRDWYKGIKDCYWYNRHKGRFPTFFGYWALETALVTLLYDLDDSAYSHMLYYPKDLVDHARAQGYDQLFPLSTATHHIALPNDESPIDAVWHCNLSDDQVRLKQGERLPSNRLNEQEEALFWVSE
ncbi:PoNe immunity protein domain-containing protein [Marinomonas sp. THO17]|uniref:PoNe immunity protein domain-containing protein n=1 Tax=Marinomonas sp. THO17 TaxID=3149048 RepID=UPI00336BD659